MRLQELAERLRCDWVGDPALEITGVAALEAAQPGELSFVSEARYLPLLEQSQASAVVLDRRTPAPDHLSCLRTDNPRLTFAQAIELFYQPYAQPTGIHPTAVIAEDVRLGQDVAIGPHVVLGDGVTVGDRTQIHANVTVYPHVEIGSDCILYANCVIHERTRMGSQCIIHSGAVIGDEGFGYVPQADGSWYRMLQAGRVVLEDRVEIGCNTTIDRAAVGETRLRSGVKIDNLVMIGHGCQIGQNSLLVAQVGLAGGVELGRNVVMGGQSGVAGHLQVGNRVTAAARTGITKDVEANQTVTGFPHQPYTAWRRMVVAQHQLPELIKKVRHLEKRIAQLAPSALPDPDGKALGLAQEGDLSDSL